MDQEFYTKCKIQIFHTVLFLLAEAMAFAFRYIDKQSTKVWGKVWPNYHSELIFIFMALVLLVFAASTFSLWQCREERGKTLTFGGLGIEINMMVGLAAYWLFWQGVPIYCL